MPLITQRPLASDFLRLHLLQPYEPQSLRSGEGSRRHLGEHAKAADTALWITCNDTQGSHDQTRNPVFRNLEVRLGLALLQSGNVRTSRFSLGAAELCEGATQARPSRELCRR